jgi:hypothetical protein
MLVMVLGSLLGEDVTNEIAVEQRENKSHRTCSDIIQCVGAETFFRTKRIDTLRTHSHRNRSQTRTMFVLRRLLLD